MSNHIYYHYKNKDPFLNPEVKAKYDVVQPEFYDIVLALINPRKSAGVKQSEIKGFRKADISLIETGKRVPSLGWIKRFADGLGFELKVKLELIPKSEDKNAPVSKDEK